MTLRDSTPRHSKYELVISYEQYTAISGLKLATYSYTRTYKYLVNLGVQEYLKLTSLKLTL
jgi:hypothetical protein